MELGQQNRHAEALDLMDRIEQSGERLPPNVLVLKGIFIQVAPDSRHTLDDSEEAFRQALAIDEECVEALLELGWLYQAAYDDSASAKPVFEKAYEISRRQITESLLGMAKCIREIDGKAPALRFLRRMRTRVLVEEDIADLEADVESI